MIPTQTLKFWGFKEHPFADNILRDDLLKLFVDRQAELLDVEDALGHSRVIGVYGSLGVGKSSFLQKLREELKAEGHPVAYVHLTADSEETFYRELLAEMLALLGVRELRLKQKAKLDVKSEAKRLYASVEQTRSVSLSTKLLSVLGADFEERKTTGVRAHTESSARHVIQNIFDALTAPLVVVFDDFEKLRYESDGKTRDYFLILSRFIATLEERFNHKEVSFVVSMDNLVEVYLRKHRKEGGEFAFSLNSLCRLPNLRISDLYDFIETRLEAYGWRAGIQKFLTEEAFYALALASACHPRRVVRILASSMKGVAANGAEANRRIGIDDIRQASSLVGSQLDEKDWVIWTYLRKYGETSTSDDKLRQALGFARSKRPDGYHTSVDRRLRSVAERLSLRFDEIPTGKTKKKVLRFPAMLKGWSS